MKYAIDYSPPAAREIRKLDRVAAQRVLAAISLLAQDPRPASSIQLQGGTGERRIRVGHYRVVYEIHDEEILVLVLRVAHRREVYRGR